MSSISQRLIIGIKQPDLDDPARKLIEKYSPGGIILFDRNGESADQLTELIDTIKSLCRIEPFIAIDFEGGRVRRMKTLFKELNAPAEYRFDNFENLRRDCSRVASEFSRCGINLNFAPVADLLYEPLNPALVNRIYSADCTEVASYCRSFVEAFKSAGIACCLKHFPGLGSAVNDPHEKISVTCLPLDKILNNDLVPFKAGIEAGAAMIMTTHMLASSIDDKISTFSKRTTELARAIGFSGVIITDDMSMGAIEGDDLADKVLFALTAGHDIALICRDFEKYEDLIIYLEKNIKILLKNGHAESLARIENAKREYFEKIA